MYQQSASKTNIAPEITCSMPWRIHCFAFVSNYVLSVEFFDGTTGNVMLRPLIYSANAGVFSVLKNEDLFQQAHVQYGTICWPNGLDLAPDVIYDDIQSYGQCIYGQHNTG